jgi:hypothetical protein
MSSLFTRMTAAMTRLVLEASWSHLAHNGWHDMPGQAEFVLEPAASSLFAAGGELHRTVDALWEGIGSALDDFVPNECLNYFRNAEYGSA